MQEPAAESVPEARAVDRDPVEEEKREWLRSVLSGGNDEDVLFRFETMLRAMDRFFNLENHPARRDGRIGFDHDLRNEVGVVDRRLRGILQLGQMILDETDTSAFHFQSYVETQLVGDLERDQLLERHRTQRTPLESLYLLQVGLRSLVHITEALRTADQIRLTAFRGLGHQYAALLVQNRYFNALKPASFSPLYDRVAHPLLQRAVREAPTERMRRQLSNVILALHRYLRILRWIRADAPTRDELLDALPVLALLHSEFRALVPFLEQGVPERLGPPESRHPAEQALVDRLDAFAFQLGLESRKIWRQILVDFSSTPQIGRLRSALEAVAGMLTSFLQQASVQCVQTVLPEIEGRDLYGDFVSRFEQSVRLWQDLWVFHEILRHTGARIGKPDSPPENRRAAYGTLVEFLNYFVHLSYQLVRFDDHEHFERFFELVRSLRDEGFANPDRTWEISRSFEHFRIYLETTLGLVQQRTDLRDTDFDEVRARKLLKQFLREEG